MFMSRLMSKMRIMKKVGKVILTPKYSIIFSYNN